MGKNKISGNLFIKKKQHVVLYASLWVFFMRKQFISAIVKLVWLNLQRNVEKIYIKVQMICTSCVYPHSLTGIPEKKFSINWENLRVFA